LEAKLQYGRQGPWKTHKVSSVCTFCSIGCDVDLNVVASGLLWATASESSTLDRGELCLKGRFGTGLIQGSDRLRKPLIKKDGKLTEASWEEAIKAAASLLKNAVTTYGANAVSVLAAPRMTIEEAMLASHVAEALGTKEAGSYGRNRRGGPRHDLDDILGDTNSTCKMEDISHADLIILAGADPSATHPVLGMAIRRALKYGAKLIAVNSSPIDLLRPEDLWLDARRGTAGMIYATAIAQLLQASPESKNGSQLPGMQALKASVASLTPAATAQESGVDAAKIQACADKIAGAKKVVAIYDLDETLERSTDDLRGLTQLMMVSGHLEKPGEGLLLLSSDCNSVGAKLAGIDNPLHMDQLRAALVMFENPFGDYRATRELAEIRSLVVIDHFMTETARMAEVVLPAATLAESEGTVVSFDGRIAGVKMASNPVAGLTNIEILAKLAEELGSPVASKDQATLRASLASALGINPSELEKKRSEGARWPYTAIRSCSFVSLRIDTTASTANIFPYASLDGVLDKKLSELQ
jgi:predicted molibdopterin-dependent oxidoreductase YjgC